MRIIIVGCGQVGSALAYQLYRQGHVVTVIDQKKSAFDYLPSDFQGQTIEGDVMTKNVLLRAQIEDADAVLVVTRSDSLNALVAYIAKTEYHVGTVVAANTDPRQRSIQESFNIPIVSSTSWGAHQFIELITGTPLRAIHFDSDPTLIVYQLQVPEIWQGRALQELLPEEKYKTISLTRANRQLPSSRAQLLETGDLIYLTGDPTEIESLRSQLVSPQEQNV